MTESHISVSRATRGNNQITDCDPTKTYSLIVVRSLTR